jgi:putative flippase GtrA
MEARSFGVGQSLLPVTLMSRGFAQFVGFVVAGGLATAVNYGLFILLLSLDLNYLAAASVGYLSGIVISFFLNRILVYRSSQPISAQMSRYFLAYLAALVAHLGALEGLVRIGLSPEIGNAVAISVVVVLNFFVVRRFVFGQPSTAPR